MEPNPLGDSFEVPAFRYATQFFFIDTSYRASYERYFLNDPPEVYPARQVLHAEVWVSRMGSIPYADEVPLRADMHVPPYRGKYPDQFRSGADVAGMVETFPGIRLDPRQYEFIGEGYLGILRIDVPLTDYHRIALSYSRADGVQFGEFTYNVLDSAFAASQKPMLVKLVRPGNLLQAGPNFADAWKLLVQSVYPLGYSGVIKTLFQLDVFQRNGPTVGSHSILGHPLMTILGLDRFSTDGTPTAVGDGIFDYRPERTIDQTRGYIIVPYLRPFDDGIRRYFVSIGQPVSSFSTSLMPQIYDVPPAAQDTTSTYVIQGSTLHQ